jgi:uncharacterized membrane protein YhaH (DUF805 family)
MAKAGFTDWFTPDGRLNRLDYAIRTLVTTVIAGTLTTGAIAAIVFSGVAADGFQDAASGLVFGGTFFISAGVIAVVSLISLWIHLVAQIRRFHDIGQSGLLVLLNLVPCASFIIWLFLMIARGDAGANMYGPDPLPATAQPSATPAL